MNHDSETISCDIFIVFEDDTSNFSEVEPDLLLIQPTPKEFQTMEYSRRIITETPLAELWDDSGIVAAHRHRYLFTADIRQLLHDTPVRFVVASCGTKPDWVLQSECFAFWKIEVQPHLADPEQPIHLQDFPGEYCYIASEWRGAEGLPIVVLELHH